MASHKYGDLTVGINFDVNQEGLNNLSKSLDQIIQKARESEQALPDYAEPLLEASSAAQDLKNLLNSSWNMQLGQLDISKLRKGIVDSYGSVKDFKKVLEQIGPEGSQAFNQLTNAITRTQVPIKETNKVLDKLAVSFKNTIRYGISSSVWNNLTNSVSRAYSYVKQLDKSLNDIRIVSGQTADQMERFAVSANKAAQALGSSTLDYTKAALIYYQQGLPDEEVTERTNITIKAANVLGTSAQEVSDYMTAIWNNFYDGSKSLEYYADVLTNLGAKTASSAEEISEGLEKFAAVSDTVGLSYEYATAALTTVTDRTRQSADVVGTAFKTLFARIQGLSLGETLEDGTTLNKYSKALEAVGISIKEQNGELKDMDKILDEMGNKWGTLKKDEQVALAQTVAGVRQYNQLMALMDNWDFFEQNLAWAKESEGTLTEQQAIYMDSLEAHLTRMSTAWEGLYNNLFDEETVKFFVDGFTNLINLSNTFITGLGGGLNSIIYLAMQLGTAFSSQITDNLVRMKKNADNAMQSLSNIAAAEEFYKESFSTGSLYDVSKVGYEQYKEEFDLNYKILLLKQDMKASEQQIIDENVIRLQQLKDELAVMERIKGHTEPDLGGKGKLSQSEKEELRAQLLEKYNQQGKSTTNWTREDFLAEANTNKKKYENNKRLLEKIDKGKSLDRTYVNQSGEEVYADLKQLQGISSRLGSIIQQNHDKIAKLQKEDIEGNEELIEEYQKQNRELQAQQSEIDKARKSADAYKKISDPSRLRAGIEAVNTQLKYNEEIDKKAADFLMKKNNILDIDQEELDKLIEINKQQQENIVQNEKDLVLDKERRDNLQDIVSVTFLLGSTITSVTGAIKTITNPDLSAWEKISSIFSVLATQTLILTSNWDKIVAAGPKIVKFTGEIAAATTAQVVAQKAKNEANKEEIAQDVAKLGLEEGITAEKLKQVIAGIKQIAQNILTIIQKTIQLGIEALIALLQGNITAMGIAAVAALVAGTVALGAWVAHLVKINGEEYKLNEKIQQATENANKAKEAFDEISKTVSSYTDAKKGLDDLTEGTVEFYEAILKANESAEELIEKLGLIAGVDYGIDSNGLINIDEDALEEKMFQEQQKVFRAQASKYKAQLELEQFNQEKTVEAFRNKISVRQGMYSMSREDARQLLKDPTYDISQGSNEMELTTLGKIANTFGWLRPQLLLQNKIFTQAVSVFDKGTKEITDEVGAFSAEYKRNAAKQESLNNLLSSQYILGYGSKTDVDKYNKLSDRLKTVVNQNVTEERLNNQKTGTDRTEARDRKWWEYYLKSVYAGVNPSAIPQMIAGEYGNFSNTNKIKEAYMENVYGYQKTKAGWIDPRTGETIDYNKVIKEIDTEEAEERFNSGEYTTRKALEETMRKVRQYENKASAAGFDKASQSYITEALMGAEGSSTLLNKDEFGYYLKEKYGLKDLEQAINGEIQVSNAVKEEINKWLNEGAGDNQKRLIEDAKAYNATLEEEAEALDTTAEALDFYAIAMDNAAGVTHKQTRENAEAAANQYKFNKAYNEGRKVYEDNKELIEKYGKAIENNEKISYDLADAMGELSQSLKAMGLSLSGETITKNLNLIKKLLAGTTEEAEEAYKELYNLSRLDTLKSFFGNPDDLKNGDEILQKYKDIINAIDNTDPGKMMSQHFANNLIDMINNAQLTAEEINKLASQLGIEIPVEIEDKDITLEDTKFTTAAQSVQHRYDGEMPNPAYDGKKNKKKTIQIHYAWVETTEAKEDHFVVPKGSNLKVNTNTKNLSNGTNFSIAPSNSKSSGGNDEPDKMDPIKTEIDRYHQVNTQITKVDNNLKKLQSQQDKFVGGQLLRNLNEQWNLLNTQVDNYNEKLRIANAEQSELANKLAGKGVQFNADGTISNYAQVIRAQESYVNSLINNYNNMSKEAQESYKDTVENAKKDFDQFKEDLDRYDELVSDFIPDLYQSIQDSWDKQIELNIKRFNMEIEVVLNLDQAKRDWNAWAKRAIQGFDAEDIFGSAQARLKDFYTYFNEDGVADVQIGTKQINSLLEEFNKMNAGEDSIYGTQQSGYNRAQAIDDLKTHYEQLMQSITDVIELQDELHQDWLDKMDEVQERFAMQIDNYGFLREIINHDLKIVNLTLGEDAYGEMAKFYEKQQDNYKQQLDFQRQQKDFWYAQMQAAEEGTKEWESARDKWKDAVKEFNSILEEGLENAKTKFENAINDIFKRLNEKLTGGMGLDFVKEQWDLINENADRYLDTINATYAIRELEKKYTDSINDSDNVAVQQRLKQVMEEQISSLKERDRITQYDVDRANKLYELELARINLQEAQRNKSQMRLRRDSQGNYTYQYVADDNAIREAEDEVNKLYNELYNFDKDRYNSVLNDIYDIWNNYQEKMAEAALINDPELRAEKERLIQEQYNEMMMQAEEDYQISKFNLQESFFWDWVDLNNMTLDNFKLLNDNEKDIIMTEFVPTWKNGVSEMADIFSGPGGFAEVTQDSWYEIKDAENEYAKDMQDLEIIAGQTFETIIEGQDDSLEKGNELIKQNEELINLYGNELAAVQAVYDEVRNLRDMYYEKEQAAIQAAATAQKLWEEEMRRQQQEIANYQRITSEARAAAQAALDYNYYSSGAFSSQSIGSGGGSGSGGGGSSIGGQLATSTSGGSSSSSGSVQYFSVYFFSDGKKVGGVSAKVGQSVKLSCGVSKTGYSLQGWTIGGKQYSNGQSFTGTAPASYQANAVWKLGILKALGFATGGYTGEWSNSNNTDNGRIALLHQKELVLNEADTKNVLNTVKIMRTLENSLGSSLLSKMAGVSANGANGGASEGTILEQNVHIDASFPNARNAAEIEEALNNLVNAAAQRAHENK